MNIRIAITGSTGGIGVMLASYLRSNGFTIVHLDRRQPNADEPYVYFDLRDRHSIVLPNNLDAIIHCAHDFTAQSWDEIERYNINSTKRLLDLASEAKIPTFIFISSMAAYDGAKSLYGQCKRAIEHQVLNRNGGICIRPGMVYGIESGLAEKINKRTQSKFPVPLIDGGSTLIHPTSIDSLCREAGKILCSPEKYGGIPVVVCAKSPIYFRELITRLGKTPKSRTHFITVPWWLVWMGLRIAEVLRFRLPFRSDNVLGFRFQNPAPFEDVILLEE